MSTSLRGVWPQVVGYAWADPEFRRRLLETPERVFEELGLDVSPEHQIVVLEDTPGRTHLVLPEPPAHLGDVARASGEKPACCERSDDATKKPACCERTDVVKKPACCERTDVVKKPACCERTDDATKKPACCERTDVVKKPACCERTDDATKKPACCERADVVPKKPACCERADTPPKPACCERGEPYKQ